jgi:hypothetical protein
MLSPRAIYGEIFRDDEAFRLVYFITASGEAQGGWENGRIAALVPESCRDIESILRATARAEIAVYLHERHGGWHRMVTLRMPARRNPLGTPTSAQARRGA